jgi:hypothetical protein
MIRLFGGSCLVDCTAISGVSRSFLPPFLGGGAAANNNQPFTVGDLGDSSLPLSFSTFALAGSTLSL